MKRIIKLTESDLTRIVRRVIQEQDEKLKPDNNKILKDEVTEYVYDMFSKHNYDDTVGDGYIIIWGGIPYDEDEILIEFTDVNLHSPNMVDGEYVQYPDEYRGDLWISEKVIDKAHNYIPLDKEEIVKIIIKCFEYEFRMEGIIINSILIGGENPNDHVRIG